MSQNASQLPPQGGRGNFFKNLSPPSGVLKSMWIREANLNFEEKHPPLEQKWHGFVPTSFGMWNSDVTANQNLP
jgi:hypothetical protein